MLGGTSYASIELTVENEPIKISGTMPNAIYEGESIDLTGMASGGSGSFTWTVDSTDVATVIDNKLYAVISVDNGNVTTKDYGKVTITATRGAESATAIIAVKPPLSIDRTVLRSGDTDETRTTAQFTSAEGVTYIIEPEGIVTIGADGVITPVDGKTGTVTIQATKNGAESDAVQITVLAPLAADMVTIGTNSRQDMDEMLASLHGQATWSVKSGESYTVTPNVSGTMITVTDSNGDTILTLSTRTGLVRTFDVERKVTLTVSDAADGAVGDVIVNVKKTPYIAEIPEQRTNLIGKIHLTANGATLDVIKPSGDAAGVITDSIKLGETGKWSAVLNNLCRYDEMGNSYYYYIEEDVPNGSFSTNSTQYMVSGYTNNGTMLNAAGDTAASVSVTNARTGKVQHPLPSSGGEGKTNIYVVGVLLMLLGGAGFIGLKRRQGSSR